MKNNEQIEKIRDGIIEVIGQILGTYGFNATLGRLFGLLYFSNEPMSLDQMAKELMVSKATISINIRVLEGFKFALKTWKKGSRKDYYTPERDFDKLFQEVLKIKMAELLTFKDTLIDAGQDYEELLQEGLDPEVEGQVNSDLEKIYILSNWLRTGERWLNFLVENSFSEGPQAELQRIEVEWEDD